MKQKFNTLTPMQRLRFGNGCTFVPDFIFTASCQHHDFNYCRGGNVLDKLQSDLDMCRYMWADSHKLWHYAVAVLYFMGLTFLPISYFFFTYGHWRTLEEILEIDRLSKERKW